MARKPAQLFLLQKWSRMIPSKVTLAAFASIILSWGSNAQEALHGVFLREEFGIATITLAGSIRSGDADIVEDVLRRMIEKGTQPTVMLLNNDGGSVMDALKIGRMARALDLSVTAGGHCYSSCALVFAGGSERSVISANIGLHRPYFATSIESDIPSQVDIESMFSAIEEYLREMNVSQAVFQAMLNVAPERMLILSDEKEILRLFGERDPVFSEISNIDTAGRYGIAMSEFLRVKAADFVPICKNFSQDIEELSSCNWKKREAALWKLPASKTHAVSEYLNEAYESCELTPAERSGLAADTKELKFLSLERLSPIYQRQVLSHPIREGFRSCVRLAMQRYR